MRPIITLEIEQSKELYELEVLNEKRNVQFNVTNIMNNWLEYNKKNIHKLIVMLPETLPSDTKIDEEPKKFFVRTISNISRERFFGIIVYTISW